MKSNLLRLCLGNNNKEENGPSQHYKGLQVRAFTSSFFPAHFARRQEPVRSMIHVNDSSQPQYDAKLCKLGLINSQKLVEIEPLRTYKHKKNCEIFKARSGAFWEARGTGYGGNHAGECIVGSLVFLFLFFRQKHLSSPHDHELQYGYRIHGSSATRRKNAV